MKYYETYYLNNEERKQYTDKGLFVYDLRGSDTGGDIACIEKSVLVNRVGCMITNEEIPLGEKYPDDYIDYETFEENNQVVYSIEELLQDIPKEMTNEEILDLVNDVLKNSEYKDFELKYVTKVKDEFENSYAVAMNGEEIIGFNPFNKEIENLPDWDFTFDGDLFDDLEWNREIIYMSPACHYDVWTEISQYYPNDIEHKEGMQEYLKYCKKNRIDVSKVQDFAKGTDVKDVMQYLEREEKNKDKER